jgi:hypothetical protein
MKSVGFFLFGLKTLAMIYQWFGLKTTVTISWFEPQNQGRRFDNLGLKIITPVSWFEPQNQVGGGLLVYASKSMSR